MAGISSPGIGSGLDINGLVAKLVAAEGDPVKSRLTQQEAGLQAKISALGSFKGALAAVQNAFTRLKSYSTFQQRTTSVGDSDLFTAAAGPTAAAGSYSVEVQALAQAHKIRTGTFADATDPIGTGTLLFQFGRYDAESNTFTANADKPTQSVTIDTADNSLEGIRDAVNAADIGVTAAIVNDGTGDILVFSSDASGANNGLKVTVSDSDGNDSDLSGLSMLAYDPTAVAGSGKNMTETLAARDATVVVDGITIHSAGNTITGAIEGVTLNLTQVGGATTLQVREDKSGITSAIDGFVKAYNDFMATVNKVTAYDPDSGERGPLLGDAIVSGIVSQLRNAFTTPVAGATGIYTTLASIGLTTERNGTLTLNNTVFDKAIEGGMEVVGRLFAATGRPTDSLICYVQSGANTRAGMYRIAISQLATQGTCSGAIFASPPANFTITSGASLSLTVDGTASGTISLSEGTYTGAQLAAELQSKINGDPGLKEAGVSVAVSWNSDHFEIKSASYGSHSTVGVTAMDSATQTATGMTIQSGTDGVDVAGTIGGYAALGEGQYLVGQGAAEGLKLQVSGGVLGDRGTVDFSRGVAERIDSLIDDLLEKTGPVTARLDGLTARISDIHEQTTQLNQRLAALQARYLKQFNALDALMAQMQATSTYLSQQLENLPKIS